MILGALTPVLLNDNTGVSHAIIFGRISYSRKALELAALQLRLGTTLGDDTLVSKCRLYIAWSQIQVRVEADHKMMSTF